MAFGFVSRLVPRFTGICGTLCLAASATAQISPDKVHVEIPAQSLSGALTEFGRETGTEIEFSPDTVRGKSSAAIDGDFERLAAIDRLLEDTGLVYRIAPQGAIVVEAFVRMPPSDAAAAPPARRRTQSATEPEPVELDPLTVEGRLQREAAQREITTFIGAVTVPSRDEPLATWQIPICPLVAGLPRDVGEFVLRRLSQAARNADAPLAPEKCHPNFLIIVAAQPDELVKKWRRRFPRAFNQQRGVEELKRFLTSTLPIRVWYNVDDGCPGTLTYDITVNAAAGNSFPFPSCSHTGSIGSRLAWANVRVLTSVIVVADAERIKSLSIAQLTDYVIMMGFAQIQFHRDPAPAPTILRLFSATDEAKPQSLSKWDRAFLKALYNTYPSSVVQISQMETKMLGYLGQ